jgi:hypothetical protein
MPLLNSVKVLDVLSENSTPQSVQWGGADNSSNSSYQNAPYTQAEVPPLEVVQPVPTQASTMRPIEDAHFSGGKDILSEHV